VKAPVGILPNAAVAVAAAFWGLWWLPVRWLDRSGLPGDWATLALNASALAILIPYLWTRRRWLARAGVGLWLGGLLYGVMMALWNHALIVGEVVRVVLLFYLAPIWSTLLALFILRARIGPMRALSIVLGLAGAAVILGFEGGVPMPRSEGDWFGLVAGLVFAFSATFARDSGAGGGFEMTILSFAGGMLFGLLLAMLSPVAPTGREMLEAIPLAVAIALCGMLPITWLVLWGATHLDPGRVSILLLLEVAASAISAAILTDEPFGWRETIGCVMILLAGLAEAASAQSESEP
jgi:drug/metabolite transporter (DMT)-like permease